MPFTLSHPAAVLLLGGTGLPVAAMVAGSMAPDVPMFVHVPGSYGVTHSLLGVVTVDVFLGTFFTVVWFGLLRDALVDVAPAGVRERLAETARYSRRQWLLVPAAVAFGSLTHVVWDMFTHPHRWGARNVGWLQEVHAGLPGSAWAQYVTGVLGLVLAGAVGVRYLGRRPRTTRPPRVPELGVIALAGVLLGTALLAGFVALSHASEGLHAMAFHGAVLGTISLVVGLLALATLWKLRAWRVLERV